jgi:hypothetical protein
VGAGAGAGVGAGAGTGVELGGEPTAMGAQPLIEANAAARSNATSARAVRLPVAHLTGRFTSATLPRSRRA